MADKRKKKKSKSEKGKITLNKRTLLFFAAAVLVIAVIIAAAIWLQNKESGGTVVNIPGDDLTEDGEQENEEADWYNLSGYINGAEKEEEQIICGIELPYQVPDTPIVIEGIGQYTGPFVEDGSDTPTGNVLAVVVKNNGDTDVEYVQMRFSDGNGGTAEFHISTLPAGKSAVVLEQNKREYNPQDAFTFEDKLYAAVDDMSLMEEEVEVRAEDGTLTLKNLTDNSLGTVYVRYKNKLNDGYYLGGITYSCKFENIGPGDSAEVQTQHFTVEGSRVLMVKAIEE